MMFPEAIGVPAIIYIGWIYSLVICSVAYAIIKIARKWRSKSPKRAGHRGHRGQGT